MKSVCFTGHRPASLHGYNSHKIYQPLVEQLENLCEQLVDKQGVTEFITGGAQGIDQLAFWAVERLKQRRTDVKILNIVYQPFATQSSRWKQHGLFGQDEYDMMLRRADAVVLVSENLNTQNKHDVAMALNLRNHKMVDAADCVIAAYRSELGDYSVNHGGTAECMRYAARCQKPIITIHPLTYQRNTGGIL